MGEREKKEKRKHVTARITLKRGSNINHLRSCKFRESFVKT